VVSGAWLGKVIACSVSALLGAPVQDTGPCYKTSCRI